MPSTSPLTMAARVDGFDWSATPLGPRDGWPVELTIAVRQMLDSSFPQAIVWGPRFTTIHNDAFLPILGNKPDALGRSFADIWAEVWPELAPIVDRAFAGTSTYIEDFPLTINRLGTMEQAWFTFCYSPLRLADGSIGGMLDTVVETTGKVRTQADLDLINQELAHRLKNTLALVQAIAGQTLRKVTERDLVQAFGDRIGALSTAHDVLLRQNWSDVSFTGIVSDNLAPHNTTGQISLNGPDLRLGSRTAMFLCLMLHELATNAVKYGALSRPEGRVQLSWTIDGDQFRLIWREQGGPPVAEPSNTGFGSRLIDRGFGSESKVTRDFAPGGLELVLTCPLSAMRD
ncbi:sensor histidine kinase [Altererythrobacter xixiisoli]|uniref:histidine kinase n=1 Tax=Croceibacterium xixiisoli TaxID=1476466 RepID=A0A6I4TXP9_9SPHN|nr:PAS domain-containing sensor histidine kinase [Croceibacterium xixiisoli]MXP00703.1 sensor histidine kinase [Croceibacterium xixiisoli]